MEDQHQLITEKQNELPEFTRESAAFLLKAAKWGKFLSIIGFIISGLLIIAGIIMSFILNTVSDELVPVNMAVSPKIVAIVYVIIAAIYLIPVLFLNSFCNNAFKAINTGSTIHLTTSIRKLKNLFVFMGVSTLILISIYTVVLVFVGTATLLSF